MSFLGVFSVFFNVLVETFFQTVQIIQKFPKCAHLCKIKRKSKTFMSLFVQEKPHWPLNMYNSKLEMGLHHTRFCFHMQGPMIHMRFFLASDEIISRVGPSQIESIYYHCLMIIQYNL